MRIEFTNKDIVLMTEACIRRLLSESVQEDFGLIGMALGGFGGRGGYQDDSDMDDLGSDDSPKSTAQQQLGANTSNSQTTNNQQQVTTDDAEEEDPQTATRLRSNEYVTLQGNTLVFAGKGLAFAQQFAAYGKYISQSERKYFSFIKSNKKCSTGAFEVLGALYGKSFDIQNLNMRARNAWGFLKTWGTHEPLNMDANGTNVVNARTKIWEGTKEKYVPQIGDVGVWGLSCPNDYPGHMAVYLGPAIGKSGWVSDFIQNDMGVYTNQNDARVQVYRAGGGTDFGAGMKPQKKKKGNDRKAAVGRSNKVMKRMIAELKVPQYSAAAMCGIMYRESGLKPNKVNVQEKNGTYLDSAACAHKPGTKEPYDGVFSYGAGLIQWSLYQHKLKALKRIGKDEKFLQSRGIESLGLDEQITMLIKELQAPACRNILTGLQNAKDIEDATKLLYCNFIGGYNNSDTYSEKDVAETESRYVAIGAKGPVAARIESAKEFDNAYSSLAQ